MRLILHAGTHKTGTTSIQHLFHANREWLRERGVHYAPEYNKRGDLRSQHHHLARALVDGLTDQVHSLIGNIKRATPPDTAAVISSERFYSDIHGVQQWGILSVSDPWTLRHMHLDILATAFCDFQVTVVLFFRRPDEFAESLYKTLIWGGHTRLPFADYLRAASSLFDYRQQIDALKRRFSDVRVLPYSHESATTSFFNAIGVEHPPGSEGRPNISPDARLTFWMAESSRRNELPKAVIKAQRAFTNTPRARALLPDYGAASFWPSLCARAAFCSATEESFPAGFFSEIKHSATRTAEPSEDEIALFNNAFERWQQDQ